MSAHTTHAQNGPIADFLAAAHLAPRQSCKSLTLWPLVLDYAPEGPPRHRLLADAIEAGDLVVDEIDDTGSVPHLRVSNRGEEAVLVVFGEELVGAKQNRISNASFLVAPGSETVLDVSCVEAGRWSRGSGRRGRGFEASERVVSHSLRRRMGRSVTAAREMGAGFVSDQAEVWDEVDARLDHARTASPTRAYADYYASRARDLEEMGRAFRAVPRQVGFVAAIGDEVQGVEAVGHPDILARVLRQLLHAYTIDALDAPVARLRPDEVQPPAFEAPEAFLEGLAAAPHRARPSLGLGQDLRIAGDKVGGCALHADEAGGMVHLVAYPE